VERFYIARAFLNPRFQCEHLIFWCHQSCEHWRLSIVTIRSVEFKRAHQSSLVVHQRVIRNRLHRAPELSDGAPNREQIKVLMTSFESRWKVIVGKLWWYTPCYHRRSPVTFPMASFLSGPINIMCGQEGKLS